MGRFQFVYIPVDTNRPLEQWSLDYEEEREVECLLDRLKEHFVTVHPAATQEQREIHKKNLLSQRGSENVKGPVSDQLLEAAASMQLVESIALLPCMAKHDFVGVTLYVDDAGSFKQLSVNIRATDIAHSCGMLSICALGDAFLGRVRENDDVFERQDFLVADVSSHAPWMRDAQRHHAQKMNQPVAEDVLSTLKPKADPKIVEITPAEEERQKGNEAYRRGSYEEAVSAYTRCLEHDPEATVAYSNRSMAYLQLKDFSSALIDAEAALKLDRSSIKARYRRATALEHLGREDEAIQELTCLLQQQPRNKAAAEKLNELQSRS